MSPDHASGARGARAATAGPAVTVQAVRSILLGRAAWVLGLVCVLASLGFVVLFLWIAAHRAAYPFDLEWMEGGLVDHVERLLTGKRLYAPPSVEFVSYIYNPLYYVLSAGVASIVGLDYLALRLVSIIATLVSFGCIFALVWKETRAFIPAFFATGVYAGSFALSGGWFDLARVDSTSVALGLGAWFTARWATTPRGLVASAALVLLAFATKQSALAIVPAWFFSVALTHGFRKTLWFLPPLAGLLLVLALLEITSDGWYSFFAYRVPMGFENVPEMYVNFWKLEIFSEFSVPLVFAIYFVANEQKLQARAPFRFHVSFGACMLAMAYALRLHAGSYLNDKMPAHAALAVLGGLGLACLISREQGRQKDRARLFGYTIACCQFFFLVYPRERFIPTKADIEEGHAFVSTMRNLPGDVLVTHHGRLTRLAGKPSFAQGMAVFDIVRTSNDHRGAKAMLHASFEQALASHRFSAIFTDDGLVMPHLVARYYKRSRHQFIVNPHALVPKTGASYRPRNMYVPRR